MKLYTPEGWVDIPRIRATGLPFIALVGGRGTGKTYGALKQARAESDPDNRFLLMRRRNTQVQLLSQPEFNPFNTLDRDMGYHTVIKSVNEKVSGFYDGHLADDETIKPSGPPLGYLAALSTFSSLRGWDGSMISLIIGDEFIPEPHEPLIKSEAQVWFNCYETIARNRELQGRKPVQMLWLSNANSLGNPLFLELGIVRRVERMCEKGLEWWQDDSKGLGIGILRDSPISQQKAATALYRLTAGTEFASMALDNEFSAEERGSTGTASLKDLVPIVAVGELCVYRRKAGGFYVSGHVSGSPPRYGSGEKDLQRFRLRFPYLWQAFMTRKITFEDYVCEILFCKYFKF